MAVLFQLLLIRTISFQGASQQIDVHSFLISASNILPFFCIHIVLLPTAGHVE